MGNELMNSGCKAMALSIFTSDHQAKTIAHVFKVTIDPFVGKLGIFRVHQGTVKAGAQLLVGEQNNADAQKVLAEHRALQQVAQGKAVPHTIVHSVVPASAMARMKLPRKRRSQRRSSSGARPAGPPRA